jgi:hypothetical protein
MLVFAVNKPLPPLSRVTSEDVRKTGVQLDLGGRREEGGGRRIQKWYVQRNCQIINYFLEYFLGYVFESA